jgi:ribosomal protein L14
VAFLGRIMVFLVSATIRTVKRGSVGEAVIVRMRM